jgi:hypothetical protein
VHCLPLSRHGFNEWPTERRTHPEQSRRFLAD